MRERVEGALAFGQQRGTKLGLSRDQAQVLRICMEPCKLRELVAAAGRSNRTKFRDQVLNPLIAGGLVEMTLPGKPKSPKQQYRLTARGRAVLEAQEPAEMSE